MVKTLCSAITVTFKQDKGEFLQHQQIATLISFPCLQIYRNILLKLQQFAVKPHKDFMCLQPIKMEINHSLKIVVLWLAYQSVH